jgi:hypothetical protein
MDGDDSYADDLWEELLRQKDDAQSLEAPHPTPNPSNQSPNYIVMGCYDCPFFHIMGMGNNSRFLPPPHRGLDNRQTF